jgi:hypothetical protein
MTIIIGGKTIREIKRKYIPTLPVKFIRLKGKAANEPRTRERNVLLAVNTMLFFIQIKKSFPERMRTKFINVGDTGRPRILIAYSSVVFNAVTIMKYVGNKAITQSIINGI